MRVNKLETALSRDCWLVWPHHDSVFFMYVYHCQCGGACVRGCKNVHGCVAFVKIQNVV